MEISNGKLNSEKSKFHQIQKCLVKWLSVVGKWLWVRVSLQSLKQFKVLNLQWNTKFPFKTV